MFGQKDPFGLGSTGARRALRMPVGRLRHEEVMAASQERLTLAAHSGNADEELIANRILDNARDFSTWERQHAQLMQQIVGAGAAAAQKCELLNASFALVHRKALFEYLRSSGIRGDDRVRLIRRFFAYSDYSKAMVSEHANYLRSAASYMCSNHVGTSLLLDDVFDEPLAKYEELYGDYFRVYCEVEVSTERRSIEALEPLLITLKREVYDWRQALVSLAQSQSGIWRTPTELAKRAKQAKQRGR